jgi:hypothetical protein
MHHDLPRMSRSEDRLQLDYGGGMNVQLLFAKVVRKLRKGGVLSACRQRLARLRSLRSVDAFDLKHGTDTAHPKPLWRLTIRSPNALFGRGYQATDERDLVEAINFLGGDPRTLTFVDLGCGKGRPLLIASELGFRKVIGVEFALELVEICQLNLRKTHAANAAVVHSDAADFAFPDGDLVLYLYNPFGLEVMNKVVANLRMRKGKLYLIYYDGHRSENPGRTEVFTSSGFLRYMGFPPAAAHMQIWTDGRETW